MSDSSPFKWSDEHTELLIRWRSENEELFTGKRLAAVKAFETFVVSNNLQEKVQPGWVKKKWENLKQKYKELKSPKTGINTEGGETTAASWKWYELMDAALGSKPSISPPLFISSVGQDTVVVSAPSDSNPEVPEHSCPRSRPRKRGREEGEMFHFLREMGEKQERRERELLERDDERYAEAGRRDEEARRRDERREEEDRRRDERREEEDRRRLGGERRGEMRRLRGERSVSWL